MKIAAIILAAGKGKRFGISEVNKTAVKIDGKSLLQMGLDKIHDSVDETVVVVGHKKESVISSIKTNRVRFVTQSKRLGTGHAVKVALNDIEKRNNKPDHVLVTNGDHLFMVTREVVRNLIKKHISEGNDATILTSIHPDPVNVDNGRIIRKKGKFIGILEKTEFTASSRKIKELNSGNYVFKYSAIKPVLDQAKVELGKELYITDLVFKVNKIGSFTTLHKNVGSGANTKSELENFLIKGNF